MRAVVLVGGEGTRLRPLTLTTPKQMLPVAEVTMIERVLTHLASHGIDEAVLSLGYRPDAFRVAFPEGTCAGVKLSYAVEPEPLDTAGGIAFAARAAGIDEQFLVVNGDVLADLDLSALIEFHRSSGGQATIALTPVGDPTGFGVVPTDERGLVTAFLEKPAPGSVPTNHINAGFYVLEPPVLERVGQGARLNIEREVFPPLVDQQAVFGMAFDGYWADTGTPERYLQSNLDYVDGKRGTVPAPGAKQRAPGVWTLGAGVIDGRVDGPSLVGDAAFVARHALVQGSIIGGGARVDAGAVVHGSLLLPGAVVRHGARVEGSIVGEGAVVGEDARVEGLTVVQGGAEVAAGSVVSGARVAA